jgi:hypothetical protein
MNNADIKVAPFPPISQKEAIVIDNWAKDYTTATIQSKQKQDQF